VKEWPLERRSGEEIAAAAVCDRRSLPSATFGATLIESAATIFSHLQVSAEAKVEARTHSPSSISS
jgi:hypothetical protein